LEDERRLESLLAELAAEFPGFRLIRKDDSPFQALIGRLLMLIGQTAYMEQYVTTMGRTIYVNRGWETRPALERFTVLRHERVHLRQFRRYGLIPMAIAYVLLPLPIGLAWCRARLEWEAYAESIRVMRHVYGDAHVDRPDVRGHIVAQFCGPSYGFMWPFRRTVERWYEAVRLGPLPPLS
jgi:hypothetical protein